MAGSEPLPGEPAKPSTMPDSQLEEKLSSLQLSDGVGATEDRTVPRSDVGNTPDASEQGSGTNLNSPTTKVTPPESELYVDQRINPSSTAGTAAVNPDTSTAEVVVDAAIETGTSLPSKKPSITVVDFTGIAHVFPWHLCRSWKDMEELINLAFPDNGITMLEVSIGKYRLLDPYNASFLPQHWEMLVEPGWRVSLVLASQLSANRTNSAAHEPGDTSSSEENQIFETMYQADLQHTVNFFSRGKFGKSDEFLYNTSYDEPIVLDMTGISARELPVLEEMSSVIYNQWRIPPDKKEQLGKPQFKMNDGDCIGSATLRIHSPFLLNVLRSVIEYSSKAPTGNKDSLKDGRFEYPYKDLYYHRNEIVAYKRDPNGTRKNHTSEYNDECDRHIDLLITYLDSQTIIKYLKIEAQWANTAPTTNFAGCLFLFKPGSDVYVREYGVLNPCVIDWVEGGVFYGSPGEDTRIVSDYIVHVWNLMFDGTVLKRCSGQVKVSLFDSEREIRLLPLFPIRFEDSADAGLRHQNLINRGKKFFKYAKGPTFLEYSGLGLKSGQRAYERARVVVDHASQPWTKPEFQNLQRWNLVGEPSLPHQIRREEPRKIGSSARASQCECAKCIASVGKFAQVKFSDYDNIDPAEVENLNDHQYFLYLIDVDGFSEPPIAENAIDRLVLRPEKSKSAIKAIVKTYTENGNSSGHFTADFIHGKGEGQIFLLHGPPGTGKTLTAESVAEYTRRPLLSITAADLGHEPDALEANLLRFFRNANDWDAIVLLDEADVYLERRATCDLRRNSIVSIFLRALDYFQGILFLTTNRVGHFDEAFMSRIHVSIGYEHLDDNAREEIWDNLFTKLKEDHASGGPEIRYDFDAKQYVKKSSEVLSLRWNGREIRNAFQTAVALAVFDARASSKPQSGRNDGKDPIPEIKEQHLSQVVSMSTAFKKYIVSTHEGVEDSDYAYRLGLRNDKAAS